MLTLFNSPWNFWIMLCHKNCNSSKCFFYISLFGDAKKKKKRGTKPWLCGFYEKNAKSCMMWRDKRMKCFLLADVALLKIFPPLLLVRQLQFSACKINHTDQYLVWVWYHLGQFDVQKFDHLFCKIKSTWI